MMLKDLSGKTVYDLELEDFEVLFCRRCKEYEVCARAPDTQKACQALIDSNVWYQTNQKGS